MSRHDRSIDRRKVFEVVAAATVGAAVPTASAHAQSADRTLALGPSPGAADQTPIIQDAIDRLELAGGGRLDLGAGRFSCMSGPLRVDPTRTSLVGAGATLDFSKRQIGSGDPRCLLVIPRAGSPQYGQVPYRIEGLKLIGPGSGSTAVAIAFRADQPGQSARCAVYNVDITGFETGIRFEQRSYLIQFYSCAVRDCVRCVHFPTNQPDSGENFSFYGCTLMNSRLAIHNEGGGEMSFTATSFGYVDLWYDGKGLMNFFGCWFEKQKPSSDAPLFWVRDGILNFQGGLMQVSGVNFEQHPSNRAVFQIDSKQARVVLDGIYLWNVRSSANALSTGPGRLVSHLVAGGGNKRINGVPNASPRHDLFGGQGAFKGSRLTVEAAVSSDDPTDGPPHTAHYGSLRLAPADAGVDRPALEIIKTGGRGNPLAISFYCPIQPVKLPTVRFKWSVLRQGEAAHTTAWVTVEGIQKIGFQPDGRAIIGAREHLGMQTLDVWLAEQPSPWADVMIDTMQPDPNGPSDGYTSKWVTHLCLTLNLVNLPTGATLRLAALEAYAI
jgi:hypothetical protein